ncbi:MAG: T9SS type A sorting domain-containing protein, partial [Chitinophagaceae bacterium]
DGTSGSPAIDTIQNSTLQIAVTKGGDFEVKDYVTVRVANAKINVVNGNFKTNANTNINVLSTAANNYGFDLIKTSGDLDNSGAWNARIDAYCVGKSVKGSKASDVDFTRPEDCSTTTTTAPAPELSFTNPVLKSGTAKKEGAVYRFSNITDGVDAEIKLKKFSRSTIVMNNFDNSTLGWNKAFQPEFGLPGVVPANQDWYIDFEMIFYEAGTNKRKKVERADFTALDVDGDGYSISEYAMFNNPANVAFSSFSSLSTTPAGSLGSILSCPICHVSSALAQCLVCHGTGDVLGIDCVVCSGNGVLYGGCNHAYEGIIGNVLQGPVQNYANIDTNGTAVMATYQYKDVDKVTFRYGAKSGAYAANGSGIRLNSMWSKSFALTPWMALPVSFSNFAVLYEKGDASISWQAPSSEKLSHFVVQRSTDGKNFTDIATVFPGKTTSYSYKDQGVASATGVVYYRVVSVDFARESQTSTVKMIRLNKIDAKTIVLATYPNPVVNDVRITLPNAWQGKPVMLQLYTSNGTIAKSMQLGSAGQTETMTLNGLTKGLYIVKAVCGEETAQQRVVKN